MSPNLTSTSANASTNSKRNTKTTRKPTGLVVLMPTRGAVSIETMLCLREHLDDYPHKLLTVFRKDVVTARNELAKQVREIDAEKLPFEPRYVLWVDDDAWWPWGSVDQAVSILETNADVSTVAAINSGRKKYDRVAHVLYEPRNGSDFDIHPMPMAPASLYGWGRGEGIRDSCAASYSHKSETTHSIEYLCSRCIRHSWDGLGATAAA